MYIHRYSNKNIFKQIANLKQNPGLAPDSVFVLANDSASVTAISSDKYLAAQTGNYHIKRGHAHYRHLPYYLLICLFLAQLTLFSCSKPLQEQPALQKAKLSSNILSSSLSAQHASPLKILSFNLRHNDSSDPQTIDERLPLMVKVITENNPDIFGVQEFSNNPFRADFIDSMENHGYADYWVVSAITHGSPKVIFYKTARFTVNSGGAFGLGTDNRSAEWAIMTDALNNCQYFICNSHWGLVASERITHAQNLIDSINYFNTADLPIITFGDFNAQPGTTEVSNLKSGLDLTDALGDDLGEDTYHGWSSAGKYKIDWIMCDRNFSYTSFKVIQTSYDGYWPSDHWPVMATFVPAIFGAPIADTHGTSSSTQTDFYFGDVNGDGNMDKVYQNPTYGTGQPRVFLSNGDGTFTYSNEHTASGSTLSTTHYYLADVNGDNKADLITWDPTLHSGHTNIYLGTSTGAFSSTVIDNSGGLSASTATTFYFADINGDGLADKIYWNPTNYSGQTRIFLATGSGDFATGITSNTAGSSTTTGTNFYFADVNGDGKADKIMWAPALNAGKPMVYLSSGDGNFVESSAFSNSGADGFASTTKFYFTDINGDGMADKVYWNPANFSGKIKIYFSDGSSFNGPYYSLRGPSERSDTHFYFADLNADGQADQIRWNPSLDAGALRTYLAQ